MTNLKPFQIVTDDAYAVAFAATCTPHEIRRGVLLTGTCPRCADRMDFPISNGVFLRPATAAPIPNTQELMCTCTVAHPGAPPDEEGCGAYWNIELSE